MNPTTLLDLAARCEAAAAAHERVLAMSEGKPVSVQAVALAAAMTLTLHGDLFAECAAALRALAASAMSAFGQDPKGLEPEGPPARSGEAGDAQ